MMPALYATAWHQCARCGTTRYAAQLRKAQRRDDSLNLDEEIHLCTDVELCTRFRQENAELRSRESGLSLLPGGVRRNR